jgi:hypothetical protein
VGRQRHQAYTDSFPPAPETAALVRLELYTNRMMAVPGGAASFSRPIGPEANRSPYRGAVSVVDENQITGDRDARACRGRAGAGQPRR